MHFMIYCQDKAGQSDLRTANRPAHVEYLKANADRIVVAGPLTSEDGAAMLGSLLIMSFDSRDDAEAFAAEDPYNKAGLFASVTIRPWKKVFG